MEETWSISETRESRSRYIDLVTKRPHEWRPLDCDAWLARATVGIDRNVIGLVRNGDRPASGKAPGGRLYAAVGALRPGRGAGATGARASQRTWTVRWACARLMELRWTRITSRGRREIWGVAMTSPRSSSSDGGRVAGSVRAVVSRPDRAPGRGVARGGVRWQASKGCVMVDNRARDASGAPRPRGCADGWSAGWAGHWAGMRPPSGIR